MRRIVSGCAESDNDGVIPTSRRSSPPSCRYESASLGYKASPKCETHFCHTSQAFHLTLYESGGAKDCRSSRLWDLSTAAYCPQREEPHREVLE